MKLPLKKSIVFVLAIALMVISCSPAPTAIPAPPPTAQIKSPEEVLKAVAEAVNRKDVDAATALLADDVTQTLIPCRLAYDVPQTLLPAPRCTESFKGKETMRTRFKEVVALNAYHKFGKCDTSGDKVTCVVTYSDDSTKPLGFDLEMKVEAVVQNGLLKTVTWTLSDQSLAKMQAAMAQAQDKPMAAPDEVLATQIEDVAGFWLVEWAGTKFGMEFTMEGTYNLWATDIGGAPLSENKVWFEGKQFKVQSNSQSCTTSQGLRNCLGTYQAYITKQGGKPVGLKLVPIEDDDTNRLAMLSNRVLPIIPAPIMTVTFADGKCTYDGPKQIPAGMFILNWSIEDQGYPIPGLVIVTVAEGKTIQDLEAVSAVQPPWVTLVRTFGNVPGRRIKVISSVTDGPFFFGCFSSYSKKIGALGPIEVSK